MQRPFSEALDQNRFQPCRQRIAVAVAVTIMACAALTPAQAKSVAKASASSRGAAGASAAAAAPVVTMPEHYADSPVAEAVRWGKTVYLSGVIGLAPGTVHELVTGGVENETVQALENLRAALERNDSRLDRLMKCTVLLTDMADFDKMNAAYLRFFPGKRPARTTYAAAALPLGARVEFDCIGATLRSH